MLFVAKGIKILLVGLFCVLLGVIFLVFHLFVLVSIGGVFCVNDVDSSILLRLSYLCYIDGLICDRFVDDLNAGLCCSCSRFISRRRGVV